jgi:hypothetical protein
MKRVVLVILALAAFAPFAAAPASAAVPCRDRIYNDWYHDGKIATSYPISCYRDALKKVPTDAREYSSLADDIRSAMQAALTHTRDHTKVPAQVGTGGAAKSPRTELSSKKKTSNGPPHDPSSEQANDTLPTSTIAAGTTAGSSSGVPVPLLVLGGLALVLTAVGAGGVIAKRRRL